MALCSHRLQICTGYRSPPAAPVTLLGTCGRHKLYCAAHLVYTRMVKGSTTLFLYNQFLNSTAKSCINQIRLERHY